MEMFVNEKGKVMDKLSDEKLFWDLALQCDTSCYMCDLNTKFQCRQELISYMFGAVGAFLMKLGVFWKQLENINLCHFSSCDLHHKDGSVNVFLCYRIPWL
jgi:hypothetical protein